nr:ribonuclease H-like domain-containing protein [Tanacetum cinerariifolium]
MVRCTGEAVERGGILAGKTGKSTKYTYKPKSDDSIQEKLYLLHMDLCGPMRIESISRRKYILVIVDDYSRFTWPMFNEYFNPLPSVVSLVPTTAALRLVDPTGSPSLTFIDQDAPSTSVESFEEVDISFLSYKVIKACLIKDMGCNVKVLRVIEMIEHDSRACIYGALVIKFGDSYEAPQEASGIDSTSEGSAKKKGRTIAVTTEDMQKRRNDVKARTTLLLALPDEHQLRFSKYKTAQELWAAIMKTFGGNEATKKTKKNQLQAIVSHLEFIDVEIEQDDLNQKFLTKWLMYTIVWRNRSDLDTMSLDDLYNHLKVYEPEVQKKSESNSQNMAFISSSKNSSGKREVNTASIPTASIQVSPASADVAAASFSHDTVCAYIASQSNVSQIKYEDINQIDKDDIKEMDIKWNMALLSMRADRFWKKTGKKITIQGTDVAGFDKSKAPKALMAIDRVGWGWSYMENEEENHALVADQEAPIEFALMAKSSFENE